MKIHSTKYLTAGESSEDRPNWLKGSRQNNFGFWSRITLTPALSHRMGEGESSSDGRRIQPLWKLRETGLAVPSPVGRERVRVRVVLLEILSGETSPAARASNADHLHGIDRRVALLPLAGPSF